MCAVGDSYLPAGRRALDHQLKSPESYSLSALPTELLDFNLYKNKKHQP